jgi:hypothetical protein
MVMKRALVIGMGAVLLAIPLASTAQTAKPAAPAYKAPRNSFGQPDLDGAWTNATITPQMRPAQYGDRLVQTPAEVKQLEGSAAATVEQGNRDTDPNAPTPVAGVDPGGYNRGWLDPGSAVMRVGGQPRTSILTTANGQPPARKAGAPAAFPGGAPGGGRGAALAAGGRGGAGAAAVRPAAARAGQFDNPEQRPLGERCIISFGRNGGPPMFANGFYNNDYQFVQNRDEVAIVIEMVHDVRHIHLNTKQHLPDNVRPWFGDSIGWYEGDALVVETTNIPQRQNYQGSWEHLKVVERFKRVAKDRMLYQFTVEDPTIWDKPWGGEYEFATLRGDLHEYACHEGNYALTGILAGARAEEITAASKAASR